MKEFHFYADVYFEAEDLDDALSKLHQHFLALAEGEEAGYELLEMAPGSRIYIGPVERLV